MKDVCLSLSYYGVRKIVIVNGHGGNLVALSVMARELRQQSFRFCFSMGPAAGRLLPNLFAPEERHHAGAEETSVNLALHGHLVNMSKAIDEKPHTHVVQTEGLTLPIDTIDETNNGVFGKQKTASATKGKKTLEVVVNELVKHVHKLKRSRIEDLGQKSKV